MTVQWRVAWSKACEHCGQEFRPFMSRKDAQRYCKHACSTSARSAAAVHPKKSCDQCGELFQPKTLNASKHQKYCSVACSKEVQRQRANRKMKTCRRCGAEFHGKSRGEGAVFCSDSCRLQHVKICRSCGGEFTAVAYFARFCSPECRQRRKEEAEDRRNQAREERKLAREAAREETRAAALRQKLAAKELWLKRLKVVVSIGNCAWCDEPFERNYYTENKKFCSKSCQQSHRERRPCRMRRENTAKRREWRAERLRAKTLASYKLTAKTLMEMENGTRSEA